MLDIDIKMYHNDDIGALVRGFLNGTLKEIMSGLNAERGSLFLFDPENNALVMNSFYNPLNLRIKGLRHKIGEGVSGQVVNIRKPVLVKDIDHDPRFKRNGYKHYGTPSFISVPLLIRGNLLGLINISDKATGEYFSEKDLAFTTALCRYACIIVENLVNSTKLREEKAVLNKEKSVLEKYATLGKLAAGIVHEINNPLDGITRFTNILLNQPGENNVAREYLIEVKNGLKRIENITKSLLQFGNQLNFNRLKNRQDIDVNRLLDDSLNLFSARLDKKISLEKRYHNGLFPIADFGLQCVFNNIIKNALDAMPNGGQLEISSFMNESGIEIVFKDTGKGIPAELIEHIFEPFFTTKGPEQGCGLGLAICKEIIDNYGGKINVESCPGKGSRFIIFIPLVKRP